MDILGHLTGRLLKRRNPYEIDVEAILKEAAKFGVALELNADPQRLDIDEEICRRAKDYGLKVAINSDAHHKNDLDLVQYGISIARRGWLEKEDILNACPREELFSILEE
jgi:DNA polymerase (family 10)